MNRIKILIQSRTCIKRCGSAVLGIRIRWDADFLLYSVGSEFLKLISIRKVVMFCIFSRCVSGLTDFQDISLLALSGLTNLENKRISVERIQEKN
jgi:hypothetical protein